MKICIVSMSTVRLSGIGRTVLNVADEFKKKGHQIGFISERGDCADVVLWTQFRTRNPLLVCVNFFRMARFMRKYDAVLCYDILPCGFLTALVAVCIRVPLYIHCVGTYSLFPKNNPLKRYVMGLVCSSAEKIFVLSSVVKKNIEESCPGLSLQHAPTIPPGVDTNFFQYTPDVSTAVTSPYMLTVGEVKSRKGHDVSLEAFGKIAHIYPELTYVIVGGYNKTSDFHDALSGIIDTYNISERVIFVEDANDEELRRLYSHAQFFVMTSRTTNEFIEGFGIVYLEAALCGITSIGAYGTGAEDAIMHQETGLLTPLDVSEVARSMELLLTEPEYAKKLGQKAKENAHTYAWPKIAEKYLEYINH